MATGPLHDLGLTEKRSGVSSDDGCCGGGGAGGCGGAGAGSCGSGACGDVGSTGGCGDGGCGGGGCGGMCGGGASGNIGSTAGSGSSASGGCGSGGGCACSQSAALAPTVRSDSVIGAPRVSGSRPRVRSMLDVSGMTRGRCIATVMNGLERIKGVDSVDVDLNSGGISRVTVTSATDLDPDAVGAALDAAGYALVGGPHPIG